MEAAKFPKRESEKIGNQKQNNFGKQQRIILEVISDLSKININ
jgi:hypothetical protein